MDIVEVRATEPWATLGQRKFYVFVGIDRTAKFAVIQLVDKAD